MSVFAVVTGPLTFGRYAIGTAAVVVVTGALAWCAFTLRRAALPHWSGAPARLAEAVAGVALLVAPAEVAGAVGGFRPGVLLLVYVVVAFAIALVARFLPRPSAVVEDAASPPPTRPFDTWVAITAVALTVAQWSSHTADALRHGMVHPDTMIYHGPFTARFLQEARFGELSGLAAPSQRYYAYNSEVVHGIVTMPFGTDVLGPLVNLGFLALALLAAWCIGRRFAMAAASVAGVAALLAMPVLAASQPGQQSNDVMCAALLLAAVALVLEGGLAPSSLVFAGVSAGLALSTKLTVAVPVVVVTGAVVVVGVREGRRRAAGAWLVSLGALGCVWFVRNWVLADNPFPYRPLKLGPLSMPARVELRGSSVATFLRDREVWRKWYLPGLLQSLTPLWPVVLAVAVAGGALLAFRRLDVWLRILGVGALLGLASYVVQPLTADGHGAAFPYTVRYATPSLLLLFCLAPLTLAAMPRARVALVALYALFVGIAVVMPHHERTAGWPTDGRVVAIVVGLVVFVVMAAAARHVAISRTALVAIGCASVVAAATAGWFVQRTYLERRYVDSAIPTAAVDEYFRTTHDLRVAVFGTNELYGMFGESLSNDVRKMERFGARKNTCQAWRHALVGYDHIVLSSGYGFHFIPPLAWFSGDPNVRIALHRGHDVVLQVHGALLATSCPPVAA